MQVKATEDSPGMDKSACELHSPQEQTQLISPRVMISSTTKSTIKAARDLYGKNHQEILEVTVLSTKKKKNHQ